MPDIFLEVFITYTHCFFIMEKKLLLLLFQRALNIIIPTKTMVLLIQAIKNWQHLLIRL